jgi:phytoene dehydrogenase-like protein
MSKNVHEVIVVGGGIAGLSAAAFLAKKGQQVLLIEKNEECGGLVSTFEYEGFRFDAGVRALLNAGIVFPMLEELGMGLEVVKSKVSVGVEEDIIHVEDLSSLEAYRLHLTRLYPKSEKDIEKLVLVIRSIMKDMDVLYGLENPMIKNYMKDLGAVFTHLLLWFPKFLVTIAKINRLQMPVEEYLESIIEDASLRDIISQHFFKGTPTFFALSYFSLYLDYVYPKGGVGRLAELVEEKVRELGVEMKMNTSALKVDAAKKMVTDDSGLEYGYRKLIWAADLKTFYRLTDVSGLSGRIQRKFKATGKDILAGRGSDSVYGLYLGVDLPLDYFAKKSNGHFFYTPSREGLGEIHRKELDALLQRWETLSEDELKEWVARFVSLNSFEISIPGLKDSGMVPEGKTGLIVSLLAEYDLFEKMKERGLYEALIREMEGEIIQILSETVYPGLKEKVISSFSFTPLSIENRVGSSEGAVTGWSFQEKIPVPHEMMKAKKSVKTAIPGVYIAGQWTYSPGGVPMSILTGKLAADAIG